MNLIKFFKVESEISVTSLAFMAMTSAIAEAFVLGIIIAVANTASSDPLNFRYLMMYGIAFCIAMIGKRYTLVQASTVTENMIRKIRGRIAEKIRACELIYLENMGIADLYTQITQNTNLISLLALLLISGVQSCVMVFFCLIYIGILSKLAFILTGIAIIVIAAMYFYHEKIFSEDYQKAMTIEGKFCNMLNDTLNGFKELKMNRARNKEHLDFLVEVISESEQININTQVSFVTKTLFTQISFYLLLAAVGFLMPRLGEAYSELIIRITAAILFIMGPIFMIVSAIPQLFRVNASIGTLYNLEEELDAAGKGEERVSKREITTFKEIRYEEVVFQYRDAEKTSIFTLGPLSFSVQSGEILFIVGGNGSGKTTLLKLLTGLYYPDSGKINLDGRLLTKPQYPSYREMISPIFSDFHLFERLYGFDAVDEDKVNELLAVMDIHQKTEVVDKQFTTIHLSTGQRKRIAMVVALMEDRPIYAFDEWAADQDPTYKDYFYEVLLKDLKAKGKTVIAISHDDRYFHHADRVLKMEFGKFINT